MGDARCCGSCKRSAKRKKLKLVNSLLESTQEITYQVDQIEQVAENGAQREDDKPAHGEGADEGDQCGEEEEHQCGHFLLEDEVKSVQPVFTATTFAAAVHL